MKAEEFLDVLGIEDDTIYDNAEKMHALSCLLKEYANQRVIEELEDIRESMGQTYPEYHAEIVEERIKELKQG